MAEDIRSIDNNVLITIGDSSPEYSSYFVDIVDFISFHDIGVWSPYPENKPWNATLEDLRIRLKNRIDIAKSYGKPVVLEEYAIDPQYVFDKQLLMLGKIMYQPVDYLRTILEIIFEEKIGAMFWVININSGDGLNLAVNDDGNITDIGHIIEMHSSKILKERFIQK